MLSICEVDEMKQTSDWKGKKVLVIGIARQGIALTRYLSHHGAEVIVNDQRDIDQLRRSSRRTAGHRCPMGRRRPPLFHSGGNGFSVHFRGGATRSTDRA